MYCFNCGNPDQKENEYCRRCGTHIPDPKVPEAFAWGGSTPKRHVDTSLFFNVITAVTCLIMGVLLLSNLNSRGDLTFLITVAGSLLLTIAFWQVSSFTVGLKLRKKLTGAQAAKTNDDVPRMTPAITNDLLPAADPENIVPNSVTEVTTRNLSKLRRE